MKIAEFFYLVKSDLFRYSGDTSIKSFLYYWLTPGFNFSFWLRMCQFSYQHTISRILLFPIVYVILRLKKIRYGIQISHETEFGSGLHIGHFGGIVISPKAKFGNNCNLSHQVTIGVINRGNRKGAPVIGNNVYIGPGAKVIGKVRIGDYAAIGANCVVTKDIPDHAVAIGIPAEVISYKGSEGYVERVLNPNKV